MSELTAGRQASTTLVVIPTYNNAASLAAVVTGVRQHVADILVVDDGSTDDTAAVIAAFPQIQVLRHATNKGKGEALLSGFAYAHRQGFDNAVVIDADGQHYPDDLPLFLRKVAAHPGHIVIGCRNFDARDAGDVPGSSRFGRKFSNFWVWAETGMQLPDTQSGFRSYPVRDLPLQGLHCRRYDFEIEILTRAIWAGIPVVSAPIRVFYPQRAERISHFHPWKDNARLTVLHTKLVTRHIVSRLFGLDLKKHAAQGIVQNDAERERRGAQVLGLALRALPVSVCYAFAPLVLILYYCLGRSSRQGLRDFYQHLNGRAGFWSVFQNYLFFGVSLIDRLTFAAGRFNAADKVSVTKRPERFQGPAILLGAHFGDWTFCGSALSDKRAQSIAVVMDMRLTPKFASQVREQARGRFEFIDASGSGLDVILKVKSVLDQGGLVCFLGDRNKPGMPSLQIPFLGREAPFPLGPYQLATRLKVPIYSFFCLKSAYRPRAPYVVYIDEIWNAHDEVPAALLARRYVAHLEDHVRRAPRHWFNFFPFWGRKDAHLAGQPAVN